MNFLNAFFGLGTLAIATYAYMRRSDGFGVLLLALLAVGGLWNFAVGIKFEQDLFTYSTSRIRFCEMRSSFLSCMATWDYERYRALQLTSAPDEKMCRFCPAKTELLVKTVEKFVPLKEGSLLKSDLPNLEGLINAPLEKSKFQLGKLVGLDDITLLDSSNIATSRGAAIQYKGEARHDNVLPSLINYDRKCLNASHFRILVLEEKVVTITWIADVKKACFDLVWLPEIARQRDFKLDERFRSTSTVATAIRYADSEAARLLVVSSRSPINDRDHVGLRISLTSAIFPLTNSYDDHAARGIFDDPEAIAQR